MAMKGVRFFILNTIHSEILKQLIESVKLSSIGMAVVVKMLSEHPDFDMEDTLDYFYRIGNKLAYETLLALSSGVKLQIDKIDDTLLTSKAFLYCLNCFADIGSDFAKSILSRFQWPSPASSGSTSQEDDIESSQEEDIEKLARELADLTLSRDEQAPFAEMSSETGLRFRRLARSRTESEQLETEEDKPIKKSEEKEKKELRPS